MGDRPTEQHVTAPRRPGWPRVLLTASLLLITARAQSVASTRGTETTPVRPEARSDAIRGIVQNEAGATISGATCEVYDDKSWSYASWNPGPDYELGDLRGRVVTGPDGMFSFSRDLSLAEDWVVKVGHPDYAVRRLPIEVKQIRSQLRVTLSPGSSVAGTVRDQRGKPLENATVLVSGGKRGNGTRDPRRELERSTTTDSNGRFLVEHVSLEHGMEIRASSVGLATAEANVDPQSGAAAVEVDLRLGPGGSVRGKLLEATTGFPIAQAWVQAIPVGADGKDARSSRRPNCCAQSKADGTYSIEGTDTGAYEVTLRAYGYQGATSTNEWDLWPKKTVDRTPADGIDFLLKPSHGARGRVVDDATGQPISRFRAAAAGREDLFLPLFGRHEFGPPQFVGGRFEIGDMLEDHIFATAPGYAGGVSVGIASGRSDGLEIRLKRGGTATGRLLAPDGDPVAGALVGVDYPGAARFDHRDDGHNMRHHCPETRSNVDGTFAIPSLLAGSYMMFVRHPDFAPHDSQPLTIQGAGETSIAPISLAWGARIQGVVRLPDRSPDRRATVVVWEEVPQAASSDGPFAFIGAHYAKQAAVHRGRRVKTDDEGRYEVSALPPGRYHVDIAERDGGSVQWQGRVITLSARQVERVDF